MTNKRIKKIDTTAFGSITGLSGVWIYILIFSDRSGSALISGIILSLIVIVYTILNWCKEIIFEDDKIVFVKLFSEKVINKSEISNVSMIKNTYIQFECNDTKMKISLTDTSKNDVSYIKEYFNIL